MAFEVFTDAADGLGVGQATLHGHWTGATVSGEARQVDAKFLEGYDAASSGTNAVIYYNQENGSHSHVLSGLDPDRTLVFDFRGKDFFGGDNYVGGGELSFKTYAAGMTFGTPHASNITINSANVDIDFNPNTNESAASVQVFYKKDGAGSWTAGGIIYNQTGQSVRNLQYSLSGLDPGSLYHFYFHAVRDSANATTADSAEGTFTTSAAYTTTLAETLTLTDTFESGAGVVHLFRTCDEVLTLTDLTDPGAFAKSGAADPLDVNAELIQNLYMIEET